MGTRKGLPSYARQLATNRANGAIVRADPVLWRARLDRENERRRAKTAGVVLEDWRRRRWSEYGPAATLKREKR